MLIHFSFTEMIGADGIIKIEQDRKGFIGIVVHSKRFIDFDVIRHNIGPYKTGAEEGNRTPDILLGKQTLYL